VEDPWKAIGIRAAGVQPEVAPKHERRGSAMVAQNARPWVSVYRGLARLSGRRALDARRRP
jgi:hypothetical protein